MAQPLGHRRKQPGPSNLRHEIGVEPVVDDETMHQHCVQEQNSQTTVPQTQLEENEIAADFKRDPPESPSTAALLTKCAFTRNDTQAQSNAPPFNPLPKPVFNRERREPSPIFSPFAVARPVRNPVSKDNVSEDKDGAQPLDSRKVSGQPASEQVKVVQGQLRLQSPFATMTDCSTDERMYRDQHQSAPIAEWRNGDVDHSGGHILQIIVGDKGQHRLEPANEPRRKLTDDISPLTPESTDKAETKIELDSRPLATTSALTGKICATRKVQQPTGRKGKKKRRPSQPAQHFALPRPALGELAHSENNAGNGVTLSKAHAASEISAQGSSSGPTNNQDYEHQAGEGIFKVCPEITDVGSGMCQRPAQELSTQQNAHIVSEAADEGQMPRAATFQARPGRISPVVDAKANIRYQHFSEAPTRSEMTTVPEVIPAGDFSPSDGQYPGQKTVVEPADEVNLSEISRNFNIRDFKTLSGRLLALDHARHRMQEPAELLDTSQVANDHQQDKDATRRHLPFSELQQNPQSCITQPFTEPPERVPGHEKFIGEESYTPRAVDRLEVMASTYGHEQSADTPLEKRAEETVPIHQNDFSIHNAPGVTSLPTDVDHSRLRSPQVPETNAATQGSGLGGKDFRPEQHDMLAKAPKLRDNQPRYNRREQRAARVSKISNKSQSEIRRESSGKSNNDIGPSYSDIFEQQIQSLRTSYYSEYVRQEYQWKSKVEIRDEKIRYLQAQIKKAEERIAESETSQVERLVTMKQQGKSVKDLLKYVKGLSNDHHKFKETTKTYTDHCSAILTAKIRDLEEEKKTMERDFLGVIETLRNNQRSCNEVLQDCYSRLEVSESKRLVLVENLHTQTVLIQEESKKRTELEHQILSSLQLVQQTFHNDQRVTRGKLEIIEKAVKAATEDDSRDLCIKECMKALKNLKTTPLLSIKDVQTAEGMLRYVHNSIGSQYASLRDLIKGSGASTEDLKRSCQNQLNTLQNDVLDLKRTNAELQECQNLNDSLNRQLVFKNAQSAELHKRIDDLVSSEGELRARIEELQSELGAQNKATVEAGREANSLREQLNHAQGELGALASRLKDEESLKETEQARAAQWKKRVADVEAQLIEVQKSHKHQASELDAAAQSDCLVASHGKAGFEAIRNTMMDRYREQMQSMVPQWRVELDIVELKRTDQDNTLQQHRTESEEAQRKAQDLQHKLWDLEAHANTVQRERSDIEKHLKSATEENSALSLRYDSIKAKLENVSDTLRIRERQLTTFREKHAARGATLSTATEDPLRAQEMEKQSETEDMRIKADYMLANHIQQARSERGKAQGENTVLQESDQDMRVYLHEAHSYAKTATEKAEADVSAEKSRLVQEVETVKKGKRECEYERDRIAMKATEESQAIAARHRQEIERLNQQLELSLQAPKEFKDRRGCTEYGKNHELKTRKMNSAKTKAKLVGEVQSYTEQADKKRADDIATVRSQLPDKYQNRQHSAQNEDMLLEKPSRATSRAVSTSPLEWRPGFSGKFTRKSDRYDTSIHSSNLTDHPREETGKQRDHCVSNSASAARDKHRSDDRSCLNHLSGTVQPHNPYMPVISGFQERALGTQEVTPKTQILTPETRKLDSGTSNLMHNRQGVRTDTQNEGLTILPQPALGMGPDVASVQNEDFPNEMLLTSTSQLSSPENSSNEEPGMLLGSGLHTIQKSTDMTEPYLDGKKAPYRTITPDPAIAFQFGESESPSHPTRPMSQANISLAMAPPQTKPVHENGKGHAASSTYRHGDMSKPEMDSGNKTSKIKQTRSPKQGNLSSSNEGRQRHASHAASHKRKASALDADRCKRLKNSPGVQRTPTPRNVLQSVAGSIPVSHPSHASKSVCSRTGVASGTGQALSSRRSKSSRYDFRFANELQ